MDFDFRDDLIVLYQLYLVKTFLFTLRPESETLFGFFFLKIISEIISRNFQHHQSKKPFNEETMRKYHRRIKFCAVNRIHEIYLSVGKLHSEQNFYRD